MPTSDNSARRYRSRSCSPSRKKKRKKSKKRQNYRRRSESSSEGETRRKRFSRSESPSRSAGSRRRGRNSPRAISPSPETKGNKESQFVMEHTSSVLPVDEADNTAQNFMKAYGINVGIYSFLTNPTPQQTTAEPVARKRGSRKLGPEELKRRWNCPRCGQSNYQTEYECFSCKRLRGHFKN